MKGILAVLEVTGVTAFTWFVYKAMKLREPGTFNCSPGLAMIIVAFIMVSLRRREFQTYGIASVGWHSGLNLAAAIFLLMLLGGAVEFALFPAAGLLTPPDRPVHIAFGDAAVRIPFYLTILLLLTRPRWQRSLERVPLSFTLFILAVLLIAAPVFAACGGAPLSIAAGRAASLVFFTGLGEELFFRGYVQSRLNGTFGRPWRFLARTSDRAFSCRPCSLD